MSERLVRMLRGRVAPPIGVTDADLLARWSARRDEAAFELLLRRHAEPVWRTCVAVAGSHPAAEDAFQATFLALARRAGAVRANVPGWLHRVARHAALKARRAGGVSPLFQPRPETLPLPVTGTGGLHPPLASDDLATLHAELARLPDAYRVPVLLCHLHGLTQAQAAKELGLPLGTVATRVRRGCDRLRAALTRRGLAPAVGFGPPLILPASLLPAALGVGLGATAAPPAVHLLANGALSAMSRTKLKLLAAVAAAGTALTGGALVARHPAADPQPPAKPQPAPAAKAEPKPADYFDRRDSVERLKSVMLAVHGFHDANGDKLPADILGKDGKPLLSWRVALLPHLDQEVLYGLFKLDEPWDGPTNKPLMRYVPKVYRSPGAGPGQTRVKMFRGPDAALNPAGPRTFAEFPDGTWNTLGAVDAGAAVEWTKPTDLDYAKDKPLPDLTGPFIDGFFAGAMDGGVRYIQRNMNPGVLRLYIERNDGVADIVEHEPPADRPGVSKAGGPGIGLAIRFERRPTEREKKAAAEWWGQLQLVRGQAELVLAERAALTAAAAKYGPVGLPELPRADDLDGIEAQSRELSDVWKGVGALNYRLWLALKEKDPKAADAIRDEFMKKSQALQQKLQPKK